MERYGGKGRTNGERAPYFAPFPVRPSQEEHIVRRTLQEMEVARLNYVLRSYLRTRLQKIEKYVMHILSSGTNANSTLSFLSREEKEFAKQYFK